MKEIKEELYRLQLIVGTTMSTEQYKVIVRMFKVLETDIDIAIKEANLEGIKEGGDLVINKIKKINQLNK